MSETAASRQGQVARQSVDAALKLAESSVDGIDRLVHALRERLQSLRVSVAAGITAHEVAIAITQDMERRAQEIRERITTAIAFDVDIMCDPNINAEAAEVSELYLAGKLDDQLL